LVKHSIHSEFGQWKYSHETKQFTPKNDCLFKNGMLKFSLTSTLAIINSSTLISKEQNSASESGDMYSQLSA